MIEIRARSEEQLGDFVELLEEAGAWLWERGIAQWPPGSSRAQLPLLRAMLQEGVLVLAGGDERPAGGCIVTTTPTAEWEDHEHRAATLHKLVVTREFAGRGLGGRLVAWAESWAREHDRLLLRLDCWDGNRFLRKFYRDLGFEELQVVESHGAPVRLFERRLREAGTP